jgi:antitoxin component YwqK of YwqJK toxin-antitoxin module
MKKNKLLIVSFIYLSLLFSCNSKSDALTIISVQKQNGLEKVVLKKSKNSKKIYQMSFDSTGKLNTLLVRDGEKGREVLEFYSNGKLKSKKIIVNNKLHGKAFYFYESGVIKAEINWVNGLRVGSSHGFHDSSGNLKTLLLYNNKGKLYFSQIVNDQGVTIKTEGGKKDSIL